MRTISWRSISTVFALLATFGVPARPQIPVIGEIPAPRSVQNRVDLVHLGDLVDVDVIGSFEYDWRGTLNPEGFLDGLDKLEEPIYALCRSEDQLAADITRAYSKMLRDPKIVVRVLDRSNRAIVFLDGAVRFPQRFQIKRAVKLNEVLIIAGGITENASGEIRIFRPKNLSCEAEEPTPDVGIVKTSQMAVQQIRTVKISDLLRGETDANPSILSGDIITIVEASPIYIMGGVNTARQLSAKTKTTLSRAVAMAGGVAKNGLSDSVTIYRRDAQGSSILHANLDKIESGEEDDPPLMAYDIVDVGRKGAGKRQFAPIIETGGFQTARMANLPLRIID